MRENEILKNIRELLENQTGDWNMIMDSTMKIGDVHDMNGVDLLYHLKHTYETKTRSTQDIQSLLIKFLSLNKGPEKTLLVVKSYFQVTHEELFRAHSHTHGYKKQMAMFLLYYFNNISVDDIAILFGCSIPSVNYAKKSIRKYIKLNVYRKDLEGIARLLGEPNIYKKISKRRWIKSTI